MVSTAQIQRALDERKTLAEMSQEFGLGIYALQYRIRTHGLIRNPQKTGRRITPSPVIARGPEHAKPSPRRQSVERACIT